MAEYKLDAEARTGTGKGPARRLRAVGRVPAVLYGHGMDPTAVSISAREFGFALRGGSNVLLELSIGSARHLALAKEVQRHPVRGSFTHIDFLVVQRGERVQVTVPIRLTGEAPGVTIGGGVIQQALNHVSLEAEVTHVPEAIEVTVAMLELGDVLRVSDLQAPEGTVILDDADEPVVSVVHPTVEVEEAEAAAEDEAAEDGEGGDGAGAEDSASDDQ